MSDVKWLGHACILLSGDGKQIIIDPWIENPKFPGKQHLPDKIDIILVTHGHNDHFGNTIELAKKHEAQVILIHEASVWLGKQNIGKAKITGMNFGGTVNIDGIKISMVPSSHSGGYRNSEGEIVYFGSAGGFVIKFTDGSCYYHPGDTGVLSDMKITKDLFAPKIGLFPIGGHFTMDPKGAAYAAKIMGLQAVIPIHWGTFVPPLIGTPEDLKKELEGSGILVHGLSPGDSLTFNS